MVDQTQINNGTGDTIRDIDRSLNPVPISAKTQVVQMDAGGRAEEVLVSGGAPLPIYNQGTRTLIQLQYQTMLAVQAGNNGFVPMETPAFLVGLGN